jgi:hypothetical protein
VFKYAKCFFIWKYIKIIIFLIFNINTLKLLKKTKKISISFNAKTFLKNIQKQKNYLSHIKWCFIKHLSNTNGTGKTKEVVVGNINRIDNTSTTTTVWCDGFIIINLPSKSSKVNSPNPILFLYFIFLNLANAIDSIW